MASNGNICLSLIIDLLEPLFLSFTPSGFLLLRLQFRGNLTISLVVIAVFLPVILGFGTVKISVAQVFVVVLVDGLGEF